MAVREQWCEPGEPILWCLRSSLRYLFDVEGLDEKGRPKKGWGLRAALGIGDAAGGALLGMADAAVSGASSSDLLDAPEGYVFGPGPECTATSELSRVPADERCGCWVLTPNRLAWATFRDAPNGEAGDDDGGGFLGGALKFGRGAVRFAKDVRDIVASKPRYQPGVPVPLPEVRVHLEIPRSSIAEVTAHHRKLGRGYKKGKAWYLRIGLTDGSGVDIAPRYEESQMRRLVAMSRGEI